MCPYYEELTAVFLDDDEKQSLCSNSSEAQYDVTEEAEYDIKQLLQSHTHRLLDVEFECKKDQLEAETICSVALSREKMLDVGIGRDEVDRLLPQ
ncbi:hypothetical protein GN958_ATG13296 [Phytophthora infestans]|uniref:Uncharacterized protein n=1 Tax=Phytophthora infestans TaxID=4787 RepID=A0A8S9UGH3_PHYIN|nr:hypothetical protein GN958_ATG13296 [Phytophthora infestans]